MASSRLYRIGTSSLFRLVLLASVIMFSATANAQQQLEVFADVQGNDSLSKFINLLERELNRSQPVRITIRKRSSYSGKGLMLANLTQYKNEMKPTPQMKAAGVEAFSVMANGQSVQIVGNSNMAVGHGIFTWLEKLGYRYYFAHPDWHIIPSQLRLYDKLNIISSPSFDHRRIAWGYGTGSRKADEDFAFWTLANKMGGSINALFGHGYDEIVARNTATFKEHPEWFYPVPAKGTLPVDPKFDMSREDLVQFVIKDAIKQIELSRKTGTQAYKMITMAPSDGIGTCNTPACQKLGSITDRVYYLVNRVADALRKKYPETLVGSLAYSEYIAPPNIKISPNVYVSITTAFNNSEFTTEQLVEKWRKTGAMIGLYDYFSWFNWDQDVPGQSLASLTRELERNIKKYHRLGVRGYDGEASIGWVSKGLGYYLISKLLWDARLETNPIKKEFFDLSFGKASGLMKTLWTQWENNGFQQTRESDLARWIDLATQAEKTEKDAKVQKRVFQIKSYLYFLVLLRKYHLDKSESNLLELLKFGYRKLDDGSTAAYAAFFELGNRSGIPGMAWGADAKWRSDKPQISPAELDKLLMTARRNMTIMADVREFKATATLKTVPAKSIKASLISDSVYLNSNSFWLTNEWVMQIKTKSASNFVELRGDFSKDLNNPKPIIVSVYPYAADGDVGDAKPVKQYFHPGRNETIRFSFADLPPGFYTIIIDDPIKLYTIKFSSNVNYSAVMRPRRQLQTSSLNYAFIYVPEGVQRFNVMKSRKVTFLTPAGRQIKMDQDRVEDLQVEVKTSEAGLWRVQFLSDRLYIEGIPPFLGLSPRQMLITE